MIQRIDHIGIAVSSIAEARVFYEALGLAIEAIEEVPQEGVRVAFLRLGESRLELLEPLSDESPIARFLARRGPGVHHICLATDDVFAASAELGAAGLPLLKETPSRGAEGCWVQFVHPRAAAGVLYELSQPAREGDGGP